MGKLNVTMLRYLSREDFRVLTAVSKHFYLNLRLVYITARLSTCFRLKWV